MCVDGRFSKIRSHLHKTITVFLINIDAWAVLSACVVAKVVPVCSYHVYSNTNVVAKASQLY